MKYVIGILAVAGFCSAAVADSPSAVVSDACVDQFVAQGVISGISVSLNRCDCDSDDGKIKMSLNDCGEYILELKSIDGSSSSDQGIVKTRNIKPGETDRKESFSLVGLYDRNNKVQYEVDVRKNGNLIATCIVSGDKGVELSKRPVVNSAKPVAQSKKPAVSGAFSKRK